VDERIKRLELQLEDLRQALKIPGIPAAIVKDQKLLWAKGIGFADVDDRQVGRSLSREPGELRADHEEDMNVLADKLFDRRPGGRAIPTGDPTLDNLDGADFLHAVVVRRPWVVGASVGEGSARATIRTLSPLAEASGKAWTAVTPSG
jgi:hypothetical protein